MHPFIKADLESAIAALCQCRSRAERMVAQAEDRASRVAQMKKPPDDYDAGEVAALRRDRDFLKGLVKHCEAESTKGA